MGLEKPQSLCAEIYMKGKHMAPRARSLVAIGVLAIISFSCMNHAAQHGDGTDYFEGSKSPSEARILSHLEHGNSRWSSIKGHVADRDSGGPITGVNVLVRKTTFGAQTNDHGDFVISRIPAGTYQIIFTCVGFKSAILDSVSIQANDLITIECRLAFAGGVIN